LKAQVAALKGKKVLFWDEMRLGGLDQVRHRWAPRGMKLVQKVEMRFEWTYLVLAVAPGSGEIWWTWIADMRAESHKQALEAAVQATGMAAVIWDRAPGHRAKALEGVPVRRIYLPPYSPELNPVERLFQEIRRAVEGYRYATLEEKQQAVEDLLRQWQEQGDQVRSLTNWAWIQEAFNCPP